MDFPEGEVIGSDAMVAAREAFFAYGELVHQREAKVVLFGGEIDFEETAGEQGGGFPADLAAETGFLASALNRVDVAKEVEKNGFNEMPILGSYGKKSAQPEIRAFEFINVEGGEIALIAERSPQSLRGLNSQQRIVPG